MKKVILFFLAAVMTFGIFSSSLTAFAATDYVNHWAFSTINSWVKDGLIGGYEDGTFRPDNNITRAEFARLLYGIGEYDDAYDTDMPFSDVAEDDWYYIYVAILYSNDIIAPGEKFYPDSYITRQDAMTMIGRAFNMQIVDDIPSTGFSDDRDIASYALPYVSALVNQSIVGGYPDGTLRPLGLITRAESVTVLDKFVEHPDPNSLEGIMASVYAGVDSWTPNVANTQITADNSMYYLGIDFDGIDSALASEPMMSSQAHSVCLVRMKDGADIEKTKELIRAGVNPYKWICVGVSRDNVIVENVGNLILLVMDNNCPVKIANSFLSLYDSEKLAEGSNSIIDADGSIIKGLGEFNETSAIKYAEKVNSLCETYLSQSQNIYYAVIPSKNYFINYKAEVPFDYDAMDKTLEENITVAQGINVRSYLTLDDYYNSGMHWKQECLGGVANHIGEYLGFTCDMSQYTLNTKEDYVGEYGTTPETLTYLTSSVIDNCTVSYYDNAALTSVYDLAKLDSSLGYEVYLSGANPLITITNQNAKSDKELVIFRDSYTSALAPLFIENYKSITLIDLRYMASSLLPSFVDFHGQDVLFLYSDGAVNNSDMLK